MTSVSLGPAPAAAPPSSSAAAERAMAIGHLRFSQWQARRSFGSFEARVLEDWLRLRVNSSLKAAQRALRQLPVDASLEDLMRSAQLFDLEHRRGGRRSMSCAPSAQSVPAASAARA